jgi:hypothetical protein
MVTLASRTTGLTVFGSAIEEGSATAVFVAGSGVFSGLAGVAEARRLRPVSRVRGRTIIGAIL